MIVTGMSSADIFQEVRADYLEILKKSDEKQKKVDKIIGKSKIFPVTLEEGVGMGVLAKNSIILFRTFTTTLSKVRATVEFEGKVYVSAVRTNDIEAGKQACIKYLSQKIYGFKNLKYDWIFDFPYINAEYLNNMALENKIEGALNEIKYEITEL